MLVRRVVGIWRKLAPRDPPLLLAFAVGPIAGSIWWEWFAPRFDSLYVDRPYQDFLIWVGIDLIPPAIFLLLFWVGYNACLAIVRRAGGRAQ